MISLHPCRGPITLRAAVNLYTLLVLLNTDWSCCLMQALWQKLDLSDFYCILVRCVMEKKDEQDAGNSGKNTATGIMFCGCVTISTLYNLTITSSLRAGLHRWQRHLCVQLSEGGEADLPSSEEEKGPVQGQWEPEGLEWEQQATATENPERRERTGKTRKGCAEHDRPCCDPEPTMLVQTLALTKPVRAWRLTETQTSRLRLLWFFVWNVSDFCAVTSKTACSATQSLMKKKPTPGYSLSCCWHAVAISSRFTT